MNPGSLTESSLSTNGKRESPLLVILAFATIYVVWGSTYFFIQVAVGQFPPMMLGALRFLAAGLLLMAWCMVRGEPVGNWVQIRTYFITGLMMLLMGTGAVIWAEKWLPSSLVAILISSAPFWFVLLDIPQWKENLTDRSVITGLVLGFVGVILLFGEKVAGVFLSTTGIYEIIGLFILMIGTMSWAGGSLYSKYYSSGSVMVNSAWQMLAAGMAFLLGSVILQEWKGFEWVSVTFASWFSLIYLIILGSLAAYSAYVWLLQIRPPAQVSTYAYANPVIAVLLGISFAGEHLSALQVCGMVVVLVSLLLINLNRYRKEKSNG